MNKLKLSPAAIALTVGLLAMLAFVIWGAGMAWKMSGDSKMSIHGWIALGLGLVLTAGLGGGLMWLAFYSSRRGYDDDQAP